MGISYPIISNHIRSCQIISQLRFNMFKLALLVAFAAVHLTQGEKMWTGPCRSISSSSKDGKTTVKCGNEVKTVLSCQSVNTNTDLNGISTVECKSSSSQQLPPMQWMQPWGR